MTLDEVLGRYRNSDEVKNILLKLDRPGEVRLHLKNLKGSSAAFIISSVVSNISKPTLIILPDKEQAAYVLNDLENLIGDERVLFYPESYRVPYQTELIDNANILLRAEVLGKINAEKNIVIVTYPQALSETVVSRQTLTKKTLNIIRSEKLSIAFVCDVLVEYGFERVDFVVSPGQFSVRGGIVDIFSFANENPYRVEFLGDEIDSIRTFDAVTQLSIQNYDNIKIIPNVQDKILKESHQSFFEFISSNTLVFINDSKHVIEKIAKQFVQAEEAFLKLDTTIAQLPPNELYINGDAAEKLLQKFKLVEWGVSSLHTLESIEFETAPQPSFNKNFDLLSKDLQLHKEKRYSSIIFSDNAKQVERLYAIFEDLQHIDKSKGEHLTLFTPINVSIHEGFIDHYLKICCYTDHQIFDRYHRFKLKDAGYKKSQAITLKELKGLNPGDYITHIDHGIGRYGGLELVDVNGKPQETIRLVYKDGDVLNISIHSLHRIAKYVGKEGSEPKINKLGSNAWNNLKQKTKTRVKEIAFNLVKLYAERKAKKGFKYSPDTYLQNELEASFIYEDTPDQLKSTNDVKRDMEAEWPMDRLVCGDVGFGKTEIAIRAAFKAVNDNKQVAVLVPTTILAVQHYKTFSERFKNFPVNVDYINRFKSTAEQKKSLEKLASGQTDVLIGTHKLVGKEVKFKDLGLLIIDEEQKFGVGVKDKLKTIKINVDTLTLTATPIPRTLQFSLMGARDLSVINTPPANRYPIETRIITLDEEIVRDAITYEVQRGGQVFFIHNRVQNLAEVTGMIQRLCPGVRVLMAHGQMDGDKLEEAMLNFVEGQYDVLVSTTIVESGLDIPNANTIIINSAHMFGLSDLHQMRGRVGRSNKKAFCYLISAPFDSLTTEAKKRLKAIEEFSELGSGFNIAMRDLDIRGAGDLLGGEQSGFISEIGYEMYQKILDEALDELRDNMVAEELSSVVKDASGKQVELPNNAKKAFVRECVLDTDLEILIPDNYVNNISERLNLYRELDATNTEEGLKLFEAKLRDRFGPVPEQAIQLINTIRLRKLAMQAGFEKLVLKNKKMVGYFISKQDSEYFNSLQFKSILSFMQKNAMICKLKENNGKLSLSIEGVKNVDEALGVLKMLVVE